MSGGGGTCSAAERLMRKDYDEQEVSVHVGVWALSALAGLMTASDGGGLLALLLSIMWHFPPLQEEQVGERGRSGPEIMNVGVKSITHIKARG